MESEESRTTPKVRHVFGFPLSVEEGADPKHVSQSPLDSFLSPAKSPARPDSVAQTSLFFPPTIDLGVSGGSFVLALLGRGSL